MNQIELLITTPQSVFFDGMVDILNVNTIDGNLGIMSGHIPIVSAIKISALMYRVDKQEIVCAIAGGILNVTSSKITILTEAIETRDSIDLARANSQKTRAEEGIKKQNKDDYETTKSFVLLKKSLNRLKVKNEGFYQ